MSKLILFVVVSLAPALAFADAFQPTDPCGPDDDVCVYRGSEANAAYGVCADGECVLGRCEDVPETGEKCAIGAFRGTCRAANDDSIYCNVDEEVDDAVGGPSCATTPAAPSAPTGIVVLLMVGLLRTRGLL